MKKTLTVVVLTFVIGVVGYKTVYGTTPLQPCVYPNYCRAL